MKPVDAVIKGIATCTSLGCPYRNERDCQTNMELDAMELLLKNRTMIAYNQEKEKKREATA